MPSSRRCPADSCKPPHGSISLFVLEEWLPITKTITYDPSADALYIHVRASEPVEQREFSENIILDFDVAGNLVGVEVLNAGRGIMLEGVVKDFGLDPHLLHILPKIQELIPTA